MYGVVVVIVGVVAVVILALVVVVVVVICFVVVVVCFVGGEAKTAVHKARAKRLALLSMASVRMDIREGDHGVLMYRERRAG